MKALSGPFPASKEDLSDDQISIVTDTSDVEIQPRD